MNAEWSDKIKRWEDLYDDVQLSFDSTDVRECFKVSYGVVKYPPYAFTLNLKTLTGHVQSSCNYETNCNGHVTRGDQWDDDESGPSHYSQPLDEWVEYYLDRMARAIKGEKGLDFV